MPEESTTPDFVERVRITFEAADRADFDAIRGFYASDAIRVGRLLDAKSGVAIQVTEFNDLHEARAAAERLAEERG